MSADKGLENMNLAGADVFMGIFGYTRIKETAAKSRRAQKVGSWKCSAPSVAMITVHNNMTRYEYSLEYDVPYIATRATKAAVTP